MRIAGSCGYANSVCHIHPPRFMTGGDKKSFRSWYKEQRGGKLEGRQMSLYFARRCRKAISRAYCYYCCHVVVVFEVCYLSLIGKPTRAGISEGRMSKDP